MRNCIKYAIMLFAAVLWTGSAFADKKAKADDDTENWRYEVENLGQRSGRGGHGTSHVLKVWSYSKKPVIAEEQGKKNAIHAVVFQGVPGNPGKRLNGIEALVQDPATEAEFADFFRKFFADGGDYMRFVTVSNNGMAESIKYNKEYKVGLTVVVNTPALRKYLEDHKVIASLSLAEGMKPSIMVVPTVVWCKNNNYYKETDYMGETIIEGDYRRAFDSDEQLNLVATKIGNMMSARGFNLRLMRSALSTLQNTAAENMVLQNKSGEGVYETMTDQLRRVAHADIWIQVIWKVNKDGMKNSVTIDLTGVDAYTDEQIANCQGTGQPSYSAELPVLVEEAITNNLDNFNEQLFATFREWEENGRKITVEISRFEGCEYDLESEFDDEELSSIIKKFMRKNTVNGQYTSDIITENIMQFSNVRIPLVDEEGDAVDAHSFGTKLQKMLRRRYRIESKVMTRGLGHVKVILGSK